MINALTIASSAILALISLIHLYWASGGHRGSTIVIPTIGANPTLDPGPAATLAVATLLAAAGVIYLGTASEWHPTWLFRTGTATAAIVLIARAVGDGRTIGLTKQVKGTAFARLDTQIFTPLCLALGTIGLTASLT